MRKAFNIESNNHCYFELNRTLVRYVESRVNLWLSWILFGGEYPLLSGYLPKKVFSPFRVLAAPNRPSPASITAQKLLSVYPINCVRLQRLLTFCKVDALFCSIWKMLTIRFPIGFWISSPESPTTTKTRFGR